jgi:hypothetical protein
VSAGSAGAEQAGGKILAADERITTIRKKLTTKDTKEHKGGTKSSPESHVIVEIGKSKTYHGLTRMTLIRKNLTTKDTHSTR